MRFRLVYSLYDIESNLTQIMRSSQITETFPLQEQTKCKFKKKKTDLEETNV